MDFLHANRKNHKKGQATRAAAYMTRQGYFNRDRPVDLVHTSECNMPVESQSREFWAAIDNNTRKNGIAAESWTIALDRGQTLAQQIEVGQALLMELARGRPGLLAIHCPNAALEGGPQPHAHLQYYPCVPDGISRTPAQMARRYIPSNPAKGGAPKPNRRKEEARQLLVAERAAIAEILNTKAEEFGSPGRVDHRSNAERGLTKKAGTHLGPSGVLKQRAVRIDAD